MITVQKQFLHIIAAAMGFSGFSFAAYADEQTVYKIDTLSEWIEQTSSTVRSAVIYPEEARELVQEGSANMRITVDREGRLVNVTLQQTSGHRSLDCAADTLIQQLDFPKLPNGFTGNKLTFNIAINYDLLPLGE